MERLFSNIGKATTVRGAIDLARLHVIGLGAVAGVFHVSAPHASQVGRKVYVAHFGYDDGWVADYFEPSIRMHDPFPDHVMRLGQSVTHEEALRQLTLTPEQAAFVQKYHAPRQAATIAIPAYGPFDFDTYSSITFDHPIGPEDNELIERVIAVVEITNRRIGQLLEQDKADQFGLSTRETEVLNWIGQSKSNGDIAAILGVAPSTIDTYVRRLFAKLSVNDRISATIKGVRLGLIRF